MNVLRITTVPWEWQSLLDGSPCTLRLRDFLIDGRPLAEHLGMSRAGLDFCGSPLETLDRAITADYARELLGSAPGWNQFESGRVVLYRCHCGCDYCGVISARVVRESGVIRWLDVGYEDERRAAGTTAFQFQTRQAAAAVTGFLRRR